MSMAKKIAMDLTKIPDILLGQAQYILEADGNGVKSES